MRATRDAGPGRRRGFSLIELTATAFVVVAAMTVTISALGWTAGERGRADRRRLALGEIANAFERISAGPRDRLESGPIPISPEAKRSLTGAVLKIEVSGSADDIRRIRGVLSWRERDATVRVRLVAWLGNRDGGRL